jgi:hypothetical protein
MDFVFFLFVPFAHGTNLGFLLYLSFFINSFFWQLSLVASVCIGLIS